MDIYYRQFILCSNGLQCLHKTISRISHNFYHHTKDFKRYRNNAQMDKNQAPSHRDVCIQMKINNHWLRTVGNGPYSTDFSLSGVKE